MNGTNEFLKKMSRRFEAWSGSARDRKRTARRSLLSHALENLEQRQMMSVSLLTNDVMAMAQGADSQPSFYLPAQHHLGGGGGLLSAPSTAEPLNIAMDFLHAHAQDLGLNVADVAGYVVTDQYTDSPSGTTHIYMRQTYQGLEVINADLSVNISSKGQVITVGSSFIGDVASAVPATSASIVNAPTAYESLNRALGLGLVSTPTVVSTLAGSADSQTVVSASGASLTDVPASMVYVPTENGLELAWRLNVQTLDRAHWYDAYVAADNGQPIYADDWIDHASYNVYPLPTDSPLSGGRSIVTDPQDTLASPYGWHDTNGVAGAEFTDTQGNNVIAQDDTDANNTGGSRPSGGANLNFDFPINTTQAPSTYQSAAITNLFYVANMMHDIHYHYGFTEAAGNFQLNDYGRGGTGGDPVIADAQDGAGMNNANFATPPDGQSPRMQVYLFNYTNPQRDADLENDIIMHEYGHGVSHRLTGGPSNANSLDALQSGGMGEGWSDWWALMFTQLPTDGKLDGYTIGNYVAGQSTSGAGFRRHPYSFNMTVDPITYANFNGGGVNNESHNAGEIWCSALWDMNWLLIDKYGYSSNLVSGTAGNNLALQLVMDGLKLQQANPSFLDGRDAILAADQALTGGQNQTEIWTAFARRGMGYSASDGGSANAVVVAAAYDLPPNATISGNVFRDDDGNGLRSGTEPGLAGWTVYQDFNNNGTLDVTTTTTFNSTDTPKAMADPGTSYSNLTISGLAGNITDINVTVNINHTNDGQLYVTLISPQGIPVILSNYQGGTGDNFTGTIFDDSAATPIASGTAPFTGNYKPYFDLARLNGASPNGTWKLRTDDAVAGEAGTLVSWSIQITYTGAEPSTVTDANGNFTITGLANGAYHIREVTQPGFVEVAPASGVYNVNIAAGQPVIGLNFGNQSTSYSATPGTPDLLNISDSGTSATDNLTNLDNSSPSSSLQFSVPNTVAGAVVKLFADGVLIGTANSSGNTTIVSTSGIYDLLDGTHQITAAQTVAGLSQSLSSLALPIQIDTVAPTVDVEQAAGVQSDPTSGAFIYFTALFSETVFGFATGDVSIGGTANATTQFVGSGTNSFYIAAYGMTNSGTVTANLAAGVATDAAGNASLSSTSTDNSVTYIAPAPEIAVSGLGQDIVVGDGTPSLLDNTDFGSVTIGASVVTHVFTVTNSGSLTLTLGSITLPAGFTLGSDPLVTSLAAGSSDTFSVDMLTANAGSFSGDLSFSNNDSDENPFHFQISGSVNPLNNTAPVIVALMDNPDPITKGATLTLTATGVSDPDAGDAVESVQFLRDVNANGIVDAGDLLLGTDSDGSNGWSWSGSSSAFPYGNNSYIAQAFDGALWSQPAVASGMVYPASLPVVGALTVSAASITRPANLTLTASSVSDPSGFGVTAVQFFRDSNNNGILEPNSDQLLGTDSNGADGWTWTGSTLGFATGINRYFARAQSVPGFYGNAINKTSTINNALPTLASITGSPTVVLSGNNLTITANTVADVDGTVTQVEFYRDLNINNIVDATDEFLGADADGSNGWSMIAPTAGFPAGTVKYLARARDNDNAVSATRTSTITINVPPTISSISITPDPVHKGDTFTVTASGVGDTLPGTVSAVEFYRDANSNGIVDAGDVLLGSDTVASDGWSKSFSSSTFPLGSVQILARTKDNNTVYSPNVTQSVWVNSKPVIGTFVNGPNPVVQGQNLTLTASAITDVDGTISNVEFYFDANNNNLIDATDPFLGVDNNGADGWTWTGATDAFPVGAVKFLSRAQDNLGAWSAVRNTSGFVNLLPLVNTLTASPDPVHKGDALLLTASGVSDPNGSVISVSFYRDSNNNGVWDVADSLLGTDSVAADGWSFNTATSSFPLGTVRLFARARDNNNGYTLTPATTTVFVNNKPTIGTLTVSPTTVVQGANVTLTAGTVADTDGSVTGVEFYVDLNANGILDLGTDTLLGNGVNTAVGVWKLTTASSTFPVGVVKLLARASDDRGAWSLTKVASITVTAPPSPIIAPATSATNLSSLTNDKFLSLVNVA